MKKWERYLLTSVIIILMFFVGCYHGDRSTRLEAIDAGFAHMCVDNTYMETQSFKWGIHSPAQWDEKVTTELFHHGCMEHVCRYCKRKESVVIKEDNTGFYKHIESIHYNGLVCTGSARDSWDYKPVVWM